MGLSPYEIGFGIEPKKTRLFNLSSSKDNIVICKPIQQSQSSSLPYHRHTDHLGRHAQIKKLQKGTLVP